MGGTQCSPTVHKNPMPAICDWYLPVCAFTAGLRVQHGGGKLGNCPCSLSVGSLPGQAVFLASCCLHMFPLLCPHMTPFWLHCWDDPLMELQYYSLSTDSLHPTGIEWSLSSLYLLLFFASSFPVSPCDKHSWCGAQFHPIWCFSESSRSSLASEELTMRGELLFKL